MPGIYQFSANGEVVVRLRNSEDVTITYNVSSVFYFICSTIQAIFNVLGAIKFKHFQKSQNAKLNDARLFYISFIFFAMQLFRSFHNVSRPFFTNNPEINYILQMSVPIVADIYAWSGSISLVLLSPSTRKAYVNYYSQCFGFTFFISESTLSTLPKITTTAVQKISHK
uniref:Serpentine receptor class gamma n=1 Tax=Panagrolaimus sp. PS1159 TaxID=55785 RepID=A0AC35G5M8_9BILA